MYVIFMYYSIFIFQMDSFILIIPYQIVYLFITFMIVLFSHFYYIIGKSLQHNINGKKELKIHMRRIILHQVEIFKLDRK